jgi:hypothetical protein
MTTHDNVRKRLAELEDDLAATRDDWIDWLREATDGKIPRPVATLHMDYARRTVQIYDLSHWRHGVAAIMVADHSVQVVVFAFESVRDALAGLVRDLADQHEATLADEGLAATDHPRW